VIHVRAELRFKKVTLVFVQSSSCKLCTKSRCCTKTKRRSNLELRAY